MIAGKVVNFSLGALDVRLVAAEEFNYSIAVTINRSHYSFAGKTDPRFASKTDPPNVSCLTIIMIYFVVFFSFSFLVDALNLQLSLPVSMMWQW